MKSNLCHFVMIPFIIIEELTENLDNSLLHPQFQQHRSGNIHGLSNNFKVQVELCCEREELKTLYEYCQQVNYESFFGCTPALRKENDDVKGIPNTVIQSLS